MAIPVLGTEAARKKNLDLPALRRLLGGMAARLALGGWLLVLSAGGEVKELVPQIPKQVGDWQSVSEDEVYSRQTLYDYMDGGAEAFLDFDFREVLVRRYSGPEKNEITLEIYDLGSAEEAFGIFSCDREGRESNIGQESEYEEGLLRFRQGRFFVTIAAQSAAASAEDAIMSLGRAIVPHLGQAGGRPALIAALPEEGLRPNRTSFFHSNVNLNSRYFIAAENILILTKETQAVFAEYEAPSGGDVYLLLVRYPSSGQAAAARASFLKAYLPEAEAKGFGLTENKKWVAARQEQTILAVVLEAPSETFASRLLSSVNDRPS